MRNFACLGVLINVEDTIGVCHYWNWKKNSFQYDATQCWFPLDELEQKKAEFLTKNVVPNFFKGIQ